MTSSPDSGKATPQPACSCSCAKWLPSGASLGFLVLRFWLAIRAIVTGIEKFSAIKMVERSLGDELGTVVEVKAKVYGFGNYRGMAASLEEALRAESLMPGWALTIYSYILGPALILTGVALLLGALPRLTLFVQGLIYVSLTVGMILLNQDAGIAWLGIHALMVALALKWVDHNCWSICPRCAKF